MSIEEVIGYADSFEERERKAEENPNRIIVYGYRVNEKRKFYVDIEDICLAINSCDGFSDDYYVFPTKKERDHFAKGSEDE